jgi:CIC family chloride channel protein
VDALALPQVLGTGYGWIQQSKSGQLSDLSLVIVLALPFARILATSLSIGAGGSGGVLGPGMAALTEPSRSVVSLRAGGGG